MSTRLTTSDVTGHYSVSQNLGSYVSTRPGETDAGVSHTSSFRFSNLALQWLTDMILCNVME